MNLKELLARKTEIQTEIDAVSSPLLEKLADVQLEINRLVVQKLIDLRALNGKEYGAINMNFDGVKVTETVPKKVEWKQEEMRDIFKRIMAFGDDPFNYIKLEFEVPEKMYNAFPKQIKNIFDEARTVKAGKPSIKFETFDN